MPSAQAISSVLATTAETLNTDLPEVLEKVETTAYGMLTRGAGRHKITKTTNGRDFRIPFKDELPGTPAKMDLAGGAWVSGKGFNTQEMLQTYFPMQMGFSMNIDTVWGTQDRSLAQVNAFRETMRDAPSAFRWYQDAGFHSQGNGNQGILAICATVAASGAGYNVTFDNEYGASLIQKGLRVDIFDTTLVTYKTIGIAPDNLPYVQTVDKTAGTAFINLNSQAVTMANGDVLTFAAVGSTPTWMNGLRYFHSTATSGNILGLPRNTNPELLPSTVNANGGLVPQHGLLLNTRTKRRRGTVTGNYLGLMEPAQAAAIYNLGIAISEWMRGKSDEMIDVMPKIGDYVQWCGNRYFIDIHQSKSRLDLINRANWGRVYMENGEPQIFKEPGSGDQFFIGRNNSGARLATVEFSFISTENTFCSDPGEDGFIYGAAIPADF